MRIPSVTWHAIPRGIGDRHKSPAVRLYDHRTMLGSIMWIVRTDSSWQEMPEEELGKWQTAYGHYDLG